MTDPEAPWEPMPAYPQLHSLACAMRPDWNPEGLHDAMTAAHQAGWTWVAVLREVVRLVLAEDETPATLRNSARRPVASRDPDAYAHGGQLWRAAYADVLARVTGPQAALAEDLSAGTSPATEATETRK